MASLFDEHHEARLIGASQRGHVDSFNELAALHLHGIYTVVYRTLGRDDIATDVTQETLLSAYQHIRSFRGGSFRAWIARIAVNKSYDALRTLQRRKEEPLDELGLIDDDEPAAPRTSDDPEEAVLRQEMNHLLQAALNTLPLEQRTAVVLFDVEGYSYEEISFVENIAIGTVRSRISRGRARLRDYMSSDRELWHDSRRLMDQDQQTRDR